MKLRFFILALGACLLLAIGPGCTAVQRISDPHDRGRGYLRLDVEPGNTRIYIDSEYQGVVNGWVAQTVLLEPGARRVELRAEGFITRRFDIEIGAGEQIVLTVDMERTIEHTDGFVPEPTRVSHR
jgi:hypothetical protein